MAENYTSSYTGEQVDNSVGTATVLMSAADLAIPANWVGFPPSKIIVCSQGSATYPLGSLWRHSGSYTLLRIGGSTENSIWYANVSTQGGSTAYIQASAIIYTQRDVVAGDILVSKNGDMYVAREYDTPNARWSVVYLSNISGNQILYSSKITTSATLLIETSTLVNGSPRINDIIVSSTGDVFIINSTTPTNCSVSYQTSIRGRQGVPGQRGSLWYSGTTLGINISDDIWWDEHDYAGADPYEGDMYLYTGTDSTVGAWTFHAEDVYVVTEVGPGGSILNFVTNIKGSGGQGSGRNLLFGTDVIHQGGSSGHYYILLSSVPDIAVGDIYFNTANYIFTDDDGYQVFPGDVFEAIQSTTTPDSQPAMQMQRIGNLSGVSGLPTVTSADAGKFLVVNSSGQWAATAVQQWQGGNY